MAIRADPLQACCGASVMEPFGDIIQWPSGHIDHHNMRT